MAISVRHYLFLDDGSLRRVPRRILDGLPFGLDAIPEFAGTRQRQAQVVIENEDSKPLQILDVLGSFWDFDDDGKIDEGLHESMRGWMGLLGDDKAKRRAGTVVDLVPELKKKELHAKHRWTPTADEVNLIAADIWPGINGPAPAVESVKGTAPKKPPLSYRAKDALATISRDVAMIQNQLTGLREAELKALVFEAHQMASFPDDVPSIWRGIAEAAEHQKAIVAAHRTGRGEWYAVVEAMRDETDHIVRNVATAHVKCSSRKEAIVAGRKLLAEKADWLGEGTRLEVALYSALEWQPND